jgi:hypothetical protein
MNPLIKNATVGIGGVAVAVAVYFSSVLGINYQSAILHHTVDVINGNNTSTVVATNAPNWSSAIPMTPPVISSIATSSYGSAASGLASSTPYTFQVAALDANTHGTTTLGVPATITTDASTTQNYPEDIILKWSNVNGATGYAIYFATSTTVPAAGLGQYFMATTSGQYTFSTSTASLTGSYTNPDTTAFSEIINPNGTDVFNDSLNGATSTAAASTTALQIGGTMAAVASATTTACEADTAGSVFFNTTNKIEWGCNGTSWTKIF